MHYVYVLKLNNGRVYIGFTSDLKRRIQEHKSGKTFTTRKYLPLRLIYYECYLAKDDAIRREKTLKRYGSSWSHLLKRIAKSLNPQSFSKAG